MDRPNRPPRHRPQTPEENRSYRPPRDDLEELRAERETSSRSNPMREFREFRAERVGQGPDPALAGDPTTEGERVTVQLPSIPAATEGPSAPVPLEGPPPTTGPEPIAGSVLQRRLTIAAHRKTSPLRRRLLRALSSREGIRDAFVFQAVIGPPKGLESDGQSGERL